MFKSRSAVVLFTGLALLAGPPALLADPDQGRDEHPQQMRMQHDGEDGRDRSGGGGQGHNPHDGSRMQGGGQPSRDERGRDYYRGDSRSGNFHVDTDRVRGVIGENREYWRPGRDLPPGIRKNLQRGRPLPPGIERHWLDRRLERNLPYYEGHEWVQVGPDLVLIAVSTGLIIEVMHDIFH